MLLALALVRAASAYLLSGTSCRACRTAARMTATVDAAWDIGTDIEGAEGAVACHAVFAELAASPAFASETWARRPLLLSSPSADFAGAFTMDDVEAAVESDFLDAGTPLLLNRLQPHGLQPANPVRPRVPTLVHPSLPTLRAPGRGVSGGGGGWQMAQVSTPRGPSYAEAKMRFCDVQLALQSGTVVFNSAGNHPAQGCSPI